MTQNRFHIVEYRIPYDVMDANSVDDAVAKANRRFEKEFSFIPSAWYCRVFEYSNDEEKVGPTAEYFFNPSGETARELNANFEKHKKILEEQNDTLGEE